MGKLRILYQSVPPWAPTGYGRTTREFTPRLKEAGYEVGIYAFTGLQFGQLEINGIRLMPNLSQDWGQTWGLRWFQDFKADLMIIHQDIWALGGDYVKNLAKAGIPVVAWSPIDHDPCPPPIKTAHEGAIVNIAATRFHKKVFEEAGLSNVRLIPQGVDTNTFYPDDKAKARKYWGIDENCFVLLVVAMNRGPRKNIPNILRAVKMFLERCPKAREKTKVILHCDVFHDSVNPTGYNLVLIWGPQSLDITDVIKHPDRFEYLKGFDEQEMRWLYTVADWSISCSLGEGWGLPAAESLACGTPVIFSKCASLPEVVGPGGLPVAIADRIPFELSSSWQDVPNTKDISKKIERAYHDWENGGKLRDELGEKGRQHALQSYSWDDVIMPKWKNLLGGLEQDIKLTKHEGIQLGGKSER